MTKIQELNRITSEILADRKNTNQLIDLINLLEQYINNDDDQRSANDNVLHIETLLRCLMKIWTNFLDRNEMILFNNDNEFTNLNKYKQWLIGLYETTIDSLIKALKSDKVSLKIRKLSLEILMKFIEEEGKFPFRAPNTIDDDDCTSFPRYILEQLLKALIQTNDEELIERFTSYKYDDLYHYTMKIFLKILANDDQEQQITYNTNVIENIIKIFFTIKLIQPQDLLPECMRQEFRKNNQGKNDRKLQIRLCEYRHQSSSNNDNQLIDLSKYRKFKFNYIRDSQLYSSVWLRLLSYFGRLTPRMQKKILLYLDDYGLKHFENPLLLSDFLIDLFESDNKILAILSMSPLFILIYKCNLEYKLFYNKLYELIEPALNFRKYRSTFLFWLDLFLTTKHISSQTIASFVKKFLRLSLRSTPDTVLILLSFVNNLFIRHPLIKQQMIQNMNSSNLNKSELNDPFLPEELDPESTNAINSDLWELLLLQSHYYDEIGKLSKQILHNELTYRNEINIENIIEQTYDDLMQKQRKTLTNLFNDNKMKLTYDMDCTLYYDL